MNDTGIDDAHRRTIDAAADDEQALNDMIVRSQNRRELTRPKMDEHASDCARKFHSAAECTCPYSEVVMEMEMESDIDAVPDEVFGPVVTDFTEVVEIGIGTDELENRFVLWAGKYEVSRFFTKEEAEKAELAINQGMIEYRTKRNAWEKELVANAE